MIFDGFATGLRNLTSASGMDGALSASASISARNCGSAEMNGSPNGSGYVRAGSFPMIPETSRTAPSRTTPMRFSLKRQIFKNASPGWLYECQRKGIVARTSEAESGRQGRICRPAYRFAHAGYDALADRPHAA